jgi:anaerobic C4-dicarboxylate transporter
MLLAHQNAELTADPEYLKFLQEELAPEITKRLHKQSPKDDKVSLKF